MPASARAAQNRKVPPCGRNLDPEPSAHPERCPRPEAAGCSQSESTSLSTPAEPAQQDGDMMKRTLNAQRSTWRLSSPERYCKH